MVYSREWQVIEHGSHESIYDLGFSVLVQGLGLTIEEPSNPSAQTRNPKAAI